MFMAEENGLASHHQFAHEFPTQQLKLSGDKEHGAKVISANDQGRDILAVPGRVEWAMNMGKYYHEWHN